VNQTDFPLYNEKAAEALRGGGEGAGSLAKFLRIEHVDVGPGTLDARVVVRDELLTPFGNLHGGVLSALCDHVLGTVCYPVIERGAWAATTEFKLNLLAPVTKGALDAHAQVISLTSKTAVVRIDVENEGRLVCAAQGTVLIMPPRPPKT